MNSLPDEYAPSAAGLELEAVTSSRNLQESAHYGIESPGEAEAYRTAIGRIAAGRAFAGRIEAGRFVAGRSEADRVVAGNAAVAAEAGVDCLRLGRVSICAKV